MMETSDVRSIDSLRSLHAAIVALGSRWDGATQQIRSSTHRIDEHFSNTMPAYWKQQTNVAGQTLAEAENNLSRQHGNNASGQAPALTEAKLRVQKAKRRLDQCETKYHLSRKIALQFDRMSQELAGPLAEVASHCENTLPHAAVELAALIGHLDRYAERFVADQSTTKGAEKNDPEAGAPR